MQNIKFEDYTHQGRIFSRPITCPHCNISTASTLEKWNELSSIKNYLNVIFQCTSCKKQYYVCYIETSTFNTFEVLDIFPQSKYLTRDFPETINTLSPAFSDLYNQAYFAEQHKKYDIAGMGYRKALEVLVKDFAINSLQKSPDEVIKKPLAKAISDYLTGFDTFVSAECIRVLGNDYTHYELRYDNVDFSYLRKYLDFFIFRIEMQAITSSHPLVPIRDYPESNCE